MQINVKLCIGKTMEILRNRINLRFIRNEKDFLKWISKLNYLLNLAEILERKITLTLF